MNTQNDLIHKLAIYSSQLWNLKYNNSKLSRYNRLLKAINIISNKLINKD
jgi:hypothetical protein